MATLWKFNCMEKDYPGLWHRWFRSQCVAVGWAAEWGYKLNGSTPGSRGWIQTRNAIKEMQEGDFVVVALSNHRVGRIGQITSKAIEDDTWDPLVPPSGDAADDIGEMGRRILVRWDLMVGPDDTDLVVQLPGDFTFSLGELRSAVSKIRSRSISGLRSVMNDPTNWIGLLSKFSYEKALSDYIATYPHHMEDGLMPHPGLKIREKVFKDRSRLDVLLMDRNNTPVIVECKQHSPSIGAVSQLRHYIKCLADETGQKARGILVHGGAQKLPPAVKMEAQQELPIEIVRYKLEVDFSLSY